MLSEHPELAVITKLDCKHPLALSLASQLLENGIYFAGIKHQKFFNEIPDSMDKYKAVLIDEKILKSLITKQSPELEKLARYASEGHVFSLEHLESQGQLNIESVNSKRIYDHYTMEKLQTIIAHADLTIFHPSVRMIQEARPSKNIIEAFKERLKRRLTEQNVWNEFLLHDWKATMALIEIEEHVDLLPVLRESIVAVCSTFPDGAHHDQIAGFFATAWLYEHTGNQKPFQKMLKILNRILQDRPRINGVITGCGFKSDPLFLDHNTSWISAGTTVRRNLMWPESLHFLGPTVGAATRITGDRKYLSEALEVIRYLRKYHKDSDGLLFHCTSKNHKFFGQKWSRGIAHVLYGMIYLLEELSQDCHSKYEVLNFIKEIGLALRNFQDKDSGLWRNIVNNQDSRIESSGSTCFVYVFSRCINKGWLNREDFQAMLDKAFVGLKNLYWQGGLGAMCRGTGTGDKIYYISRPQGWGIVPQFIMATLEYEKLQRSYFQDKLNAYKALGAFQTATF